MPTSNSKPQQSPATDSPLGAPPGNDPYKTVRAKNWAQEDGQSGGTPGDSAYKTQTMGNAIDGTGLQAEPKPAQNA